jgi:excisionase family DNA binding protein
MIIDDPLLTVAEVARYINVAPGAVYRFIHGGELSAILVSHTYRVPQSRFDAWIIDSSTTANGHHHEDYPSLTIAEIADSVRVCKMTIYRAIRDGNLEACRFHKTYRVRPSAVQKWIKWQ